MTTLFLEPAHEEPEPDVESTTAQEAALSTLLMSRARLASSSQSFFNTLPLEVYYRFIFTSSLILTLFFFLSHLSCLAHRPPIMGKAASLC